MERVRIISTNIESEFRKIKTESIVTQNYNANPYGFDSRPLKGAVGLRETVQGKSIIMGYVQKAIQGLNEGESIIFSKDEEGQVSATITMRGDETIELLGTGDNLVRFSNLKSEFNKLKSDFNSHVTNYNALVTAFGTHTHVYSPGPSAPIPSAPPTSAGTPSTPNTSNIDNAKHEGLITNTK